MADSTTVGYGDIGLTSDGARVFALVHILSSVSWLASLISLLGSVRQQRLWDLQRAASYRVQLSESLFSALETPQARAEGRGINQLEFVVGMIITLGAEVHGEPLDYETHVGPLLDRFAALDSDESGYLTQDDLRFMVKRAKTLKQPSVEPSTESKP